MNDCQKQVVVEAQSAERWVVRMNHGKRRRFFTILNILYFTYRFNF